MNTNRIKIPESKRYIIPFINEILKAKNNNDRFLTKNFYAILKLLVSKAPKDYRPEKEGFSFELPNWKYIDTNYNFYLSEGKQKIILDIWYNLFNKMYINHVNKWKQHGVSIKNSTIFFIENYNLNINESTLERKYNRYQQKLIPTKTKETCSHISAFLS